MSKYIPGNQKHLSLKDREYIQEQLVKGASFKDIARYLCKDPTTISKEVRNHRLSDWYHKGSFNNKHNFCIHRYKCSKTNACEKILICGVKCTTCPTCNTTCKDFVRERCDRLDKAPYVCTGCSKSLHRCPIAQKYYYDAKFADRIYRETLSASRAGINMTKRELTHKDKLISPLIYQGQSPYQIAANHPELEMSVRTIYSYIAQGLFTARNVDLKRQCKVQAVQVQLRGTLPLARSRSGSKLIPRLSSRIRKEPASLDPMRSGQKGGIEQAHTMLRMILPKGTSFEFLTQWDVRLIVNHINSTPRKSLDGKNAI
jgi:IS30 family transposase